MTQLQPSHPEYPNALSQLARILPGQASGKDKAPADKSGQVQDMFDRIAKTYDLLNDCISFGMHRQWKRSAIEKLQLSPTSRVLDVCTGTGDLVGYLSQIIQDSQGHITGLDFSAEMLAVARKRFPKASYPHIAFEQGDATELPYTDASFDGAIISFGLRNVVNIPKTLEEMTRVVKPGGWVLNLDTSPQPKLPGYWLYFKYAMPVIGRLLSMDPLAYQYLFQSTEKFLTPAELLRVFQRAGLSQTAHQNLMFDSVSMQWGQKPA